MGRHRRRSEQVHRNKKRGRRRGAMHDNARQCHCLWPVAPLALSCCRPVSAVCSAACDSVIYVMRFIMPARASGASSACAIRPLDPELGAYRAVSCTGIVSLVLVCHLADVLLQLTPGITTATGRWQRYDIRCKIRCVRLARSCIRWHGSRCHLAYCMATP